MAKRKQDQLKIYFRIDKDLIHSGDWAKLSKAAKSVYPVIGRHLNKKGETWVSLETIAREAGTTRQRASRGMKELEEKLAGFEYMLWIDESTKKAYMYKHQTLPLDHPNTVRFHRELVDEGHWKDLSPAAHSVYIAMRGLATKVQKNEGSWVKPVGEGIVTFKVPYAYVYATKAKIAKLAGVDSSSRRINSYLQELLFASLINYLDWSYNKKGQCIPRGKKWKVYLLPVYSPALMDQVVGVSPQERNRVFHDFDRDQARNLDQKATGHFVTSEEGILKHAKGHFVTVSSQTKKSNRRSLSNIINNTINTKCGSTEIPQSESSLDPGDPGSLTSRSDAPVGSPKTPVREEPCFDCSLAEPDGSGGMDCTVPGGLEKHDCCKRWREWNKGATNSEQIKERIITDWNKRDCQQCMYRDKDDGAEYCTMAFSDQGATIGKMEYCPMDREKIPF